MGKRTSQPKVENAIPIQLRSREHILAQQIDILVHLANHAHLWAVRSRDQADHEGTKYDGGVQLAATSAFSKICDRIESIVENKRLWDYKETDTLESKLKAVYDEHLTLLQEQIEATKRLNAPSTRYQPFITRMNSGEWLAVLGDVANPSCRIIGLGANPEEALQNFDLMFKGKIPPNMAGYLKTREAEVKAHRSGKADPASLSSGVWDSTKKDDDDKDKVD